MAYKQKIKATDADVAAFLATVDDPQKRADCEALLPIMAGVTDAPAKMWGKSMVGFGAYHYTYDSGHSGTAMLTGFAPRKANLTVYIMSGFEAHGPLMARLGKYKTGKSCLYLKCLGDVDQAVLEQLIADSVAWMRAKYPSA